MSANLQLYKGYYSGDYPVVDNPQPFDVAQDLSTGNLWQYNGDSWVAPSWSSSITCWLGSSDTVCGRLESPNTTIPSSLQCYPGNNEQVPAELNLSADDLAIHHTVGNYNVKVSVFRTDAVSGVIVEVPFPEDSVISTEDGEWTILKRFNRVVGYDFCTVNLTFVSFGNAVGFPTVEFLTSSTAAPIVSAVVSSGGYVTSDTVAGVVDSVVSSGGYVTSEGVTDILTSGGYATEDWVSSYVPQQIVPPPVSSVNGQTGEVTLTASDVGALAAGGKTIVTLTRTDPDAVTIPADESKVYIYDLDNGEAEITPTAPAAGKMLTVEFHLLMPDPVIMLSWGGSIRWADGDEFPTTSTAPDLSTGNREYAFVFRYDGSHWLGNLAYTKVLQ